MALPTLILAPLAGFIGGIAGKLLDGIVSLFTKKFLINAALIAAFLAAYGILVAAVNGLLSTISIASIPSILVSGFAALPSNTDEVIGIAVGIRAVVLTYKLQNNIIWLRKV